MHYESRSQSSPTLLVARVNYFRSKRTTLYTSAGFMLNSRLTAVPVAAGSSVQAGMNQLGVMAGLQQRFRLEWTLQ